MLSDSGLSGYASDSSDSGTDTVEDSTLAEQDLLEPLRTATYNLSLQPAGEWPATVPRKKAVPRTKRSKELDLAVRRVRHDR